MWEIIVTLAVVWLTSGWVGWIWLNAIHPNNDQESPWPCILMGFGTLIFCLLNSIVLLWDKNIHAKRLMTGIVLILLATVCVIGVVLLAIGMSWLFNTLAWYWLLVPIGLFLCYYVGFVFHRN